MMTFTLAAKELRSLFLSPLGWTILAVIQIILGYSFLIRVDLFLQVQPSLAGRPNAPGLGDVVVANLFGSAAVVLLLVVPLLTMRLISDERRGQTLSLLFTAPISMTQIIMGKYLGVLGFLLIVMGLLVLMPLSLLLGGRLDFGQLAGALLGLTLLAASFAAAGLFISTLTAQPTIAAITSFGLLLLLWLLDWAGSDGGGLFAYLSLVRHYEALLRGVFNSSDILYYLLFIITFLVLAVRRLDADRLPH